MELIEDASGAHDGIPKARFIDDIDVMMKNNPTKTAKELLYSLDELYQKYKFMDANLTYKKAKIKAQLPELNHTFNAIIFLKDRQINKESFETNYVLSEYVFAVADINSSDMIGIWLGANVMIEVKLEEAEVLIKENIDKATNLLETLNTNIEFLREQVTTTEVNMARIYNWDVKVKQTQTQKK